MNTVGMLLQQTQQASSIKEKTLNLSLSNKSSIFQKLLSTEQVSKNNIADDSTGSKKNNIDNVMEKLTKLPLSALRKLYVELTEGAELDNDLLSNFQNEDFIMSIGEIISNQDEQDIMQYQQLLEGMQTIEQERELHFLVPKMNSDQVDNHQQLYAQVESLLDSLLDEQSVVGLSPEMLTLLIDEQTEGFGDLISSMDLNAADELSILTKYEEIKSLLDNQSTIKQDVVKISPEILELLISETQFDEDEQGMLFLQQLLGELQRNEFLETNEIQKQFSSLYAQAQMLLANLSEEQDVINASPKILELLEKWTTLENKFSQHVNGSLLSDESQSDELNTWEKLVAAFQKRNHLATNQRYHSSSQVTSKDIAKWIHTALNTHSTMENVSSSQQGNVINLPMSKVEQYIIYINQNEAAESIDKQLIDQFQTTMKTSRFLSLNNGINQLSIALRPDNLGEMMVRLTEINGEMTLKIIVSSQSTRQMLEANIHQLKNIFSPHQVVIEEQEASMQETQEHQEDETFDHREEADSNQSNKDDSKDYEGNFETDFHELLMNEKV